MTAAPALHLFENHDEAYHVWREAGVRQAVVVHVDAHHDLSWLDDSIHLHIGNYLCQAMKDDLVREVHWVVPDGTLGSRRTRAAIGRQLQRLRRDYPGPRRPVARSRGRFACELMGRRIIVCELDSLSVPSGPVLLDLDVDFLVTPARLMRGGCRPGDPWIWPGRSVERLHAAGVTADLVTIAYSVEGGYTPLAWKYFGDELAARLGGADARATIPGFERLHDAHTLARQGAFDAAERACREAGSRLANPAAAELALAMVLARRGRVDDARIAYAAARAHDPRYATAYNCDGPAALDRRQFDGAERAFADLLALDPDDPHAELGLGHVALHRRRWQEAEAHVRAALARGLEAPDVYRALGRALEHQGRTLEAVRALEHSLRISLDGHALVRGAIASRRLSRLPVGDVDHARAYVSLAALEARLGHVRDAVAALRLAISAGHRRPSVHARLAWLYVAERHWRAALGEIVSAIMVVPAAVARAVRHTRGALALRVEALLA